MTVVNTTPNPVNPKQTLTIATGIVKVIKLDKFPETKSFVYEGKKIESTHKASILLESGEDSQWVGLGDIKLNPKFEVLQIKDGDVFVEIEKGMGVSMMVKPNEYNGKTYYSSTKAKINILSTDGVEAAKQQSKPSSNTSESSSSSTSSSKATGASTGTTKIYGEVKSIVDGVAVVLDEKTDVEHKVVMGDKEGFVVGGRIAANIDSAGAVKSGYKSYAPKVAKDDLPIRLGNAITVAELLAPSFDDIVSVAKEILPKIDSLRDDLAKKHPTMDAYALGARTGQVVIVSAKQFTTGGIDYIIEQAEVLFDQLCAAEESLRGAVASKQPTPTKEAKKETKTLDKKLENVLTGETPLDKSNEPPVFDNSVPPMDFDDDIPF